MVHGHTRQAYNNDNDNNNNNDDNNNNKISYWFDENT